MKTTNGNGEEQWSSKEVAEREAMLKMDAEGGPGCKRKILHFFYLRSKNPKYSPEVRAKNAKCLGGKGHIIDTIQKWNTKLKKIYGFSLDDIHTTPLEHFIRIDDPGVREKVIEMLKISVTRKINPITGKVLNSKGLSEHDMMDIIEKCGGTTTRESRRSPKIAITNEQKDFLAAILKQFETEDKFVVFQPTSTDRQTAKEILSKVTKK
jgi:hypothetical protein